MSSIFARGGKLWCKVKDETGKWINRPTGLRVGQEKLAERVVKKAQGGLDKRRGGGEEEGPLTTAAYADRWIKERQGRGLGSVGDDEARLKLHVLPTLGELRLDAVSKQHVRDLVRGLRAGKLAPRTIRNVYGVLHAMFHDAVVEDRVETTPCVLKRNDLPKKVDKDPEWRVAATYTTHEIERLISDQLILADRRVLYGLKALAGLRHGEAASLRWRHFDASLEPLGRLLIATSLSSKSGKEKDTKTGVPRRVPVHPVLAKILSSWKLGGWQATFGRKPNPDDLVVPTRNFTMRQSPEAQEALVGDLEKLGLRVEAGEARNRGGHDMRSWFISTCQENGAHRDLLRVVTHTSPGDVMSGYTCASWPALCAEVAKLQVRLLDGKAAKLGTVFGTEAESTRKYRRNRATPAGFEPASLT